MAKLVRNSTPPSTIGRPSVDFIKPEFDALIENKGYRVIWEKSTMCPCRGTQHSPLSDCQNCRGTGWVLFNAIRTKMVLTSINYSNKYLQWTKDLVGMIAVTARSEDRITFMDRITLIDSDNYESEIMPLQVSSTGVVFCFVTYKLVEVMEIFTFIQSDQALNRLSPEEFQFSVGGYKIIFPNITLQENEVKMVSIRYKCNPQYYVVDMNHDIRNSSILNDRGSKEQIRLPVSGVARRALDIFDRPNFIGDSIIDNSY